MTYKRMAAVLMLVLFWATGAFAQRYQSLQHSFQVEKISAGLENPWGMAFLPDRSLLITELGGTLRHLRDGSLGSIDGVPRSWQENQGGLLGICLHPRFSENGLVYLSYTGKGRGGYSTEVVRGRLANDRLAETEVIFVATPRYRGGRHFGSRLVFAADGHLYVSLGDRGQGEPAQDLTSHTGSLIRLNDDGSVPADNPFVKQADYLDEIFTYGNRNMQGMTVHPDSGVVWTHEHGPQGGDEVNVMRSGRNYGWPVITYGVNYGTGTRIGEGQEKPGMEQPLHKWVPSIAPSGMTFYNGDKFPQWQGNLFVGSLKFGQIARLVLDGEKVIAEERLFDGDFGRIRDVVTGPDGYIYFINDESDAGVFRIRPD